MKKLLLFLLAAAILLTSCDNLSKPQTKDQPREATADTAVVYRDGKKVGVAAAGVANAWDMTKAKFADVKFREITLPGVPLRGDEACNVYSVDEKVFFDTDKSNIELGTAEALKQITRSIGQRYTASQMRVMGFADSRDDKSYNRELSEKRAEAVKNYLLAKGRINVARVSMEPMGEAQPIASNATAAGRQKNRRVEIAVRIK